MAASFSAITVAAAFLYVRSQTRRLETASRRSQRLRRAESAARQSAQPDGDNVPRFDSALVSPPPSPSHLHPAPPAALHDRRLTAHAWHIDIAAVGWTPTSLLDGLCGLCQEWLRRNSTPSASADSSPVGLLSNQSDPADDALGSQSSRRGARKGEFIRHPLGRMWSPLPAHPPLCATRPSSWASADGNPR